MAQTWNSRSRKAERQVILNARPSWTRVSLCLKKTKEPPNLTWLLMLSVRLCPTRAACFRMNPSELAAVTGVLITPVCTGEANKVQRPKEAQGSQLDSGDSAGLVAQDPTPNYRRSWEQEGHRFKASTVRLSRAERGGALAGKPLTASKGSVSAFYFSKSYHQLFIVCLLLQTSRKQTKGSNVPPGCKPTLSHRAQWDVSRGIRTCPQENPQPSRLTHSRTSWSLLIV